MQEPDDRLSPNETCDADDEKRLGGVCVDQIGTAGRARKRPRYSEDARDVGKAEARTLAANPAHDPFAFENSDGDAGRVQRMSKGTVGKQDDGRRFAQMTRDRKQ